MTTGYRYLSLDSKLNPFDASNAQKIVLIYMFFSIVRELRSKVPLV